MSEPRVRFEPIRTLAVGSSTELRVVLDTRTRTRVALRRPLPLLAADAGFVSRFEHEARLAQRVPHDALARVLDAGRDEQGVWATAELVEGVTLRALLDRTAQRGAPLEWRVAAWCVSQVADGLAALHAADGGRRPHGGVASEHVLLGRQGQVKLADPITPRASLELTQNPDGTPRRPQRWWAPEVHRREGVDARADVWALGVLLFEALVGELPFDAPTDAAAVEAMLSAPLPAFKDLGLFVPDELEAVCRSALQRARPARLSSAAEVRDRLRAALASAPEVTLETLAALLAQAVPETAPALAEAAPFSSASALSADGALIRAAPAEPRTHGPPPPERMELARPALGRSSPSGPAEAREPSGDAALGPKRLELPPEGLPPLKLPDKVERGLREIQRGGPRQRQSLGRAITLGAAAVVGLVALALWARRPPLEPATRPMAGAARAAAASAGTPRPDEDLDPATGFRRGLPFVPVTKAVHLDPAHVTLTSTPSRAEVSVNGELVGRTPWTGDLDPTRPMRLELSLKGYGVWSTTLDAGQEYEGAVTLERSSAP